MLDTAQQKVDNLTKEADTLLNSPPEISVMKEDVKVEYQPQDMYITQSTRYTPTTKSTLSYNTVTPISPSMSISKSNSKNNGFPVSSPTASLNSLE